MNKFVIATLATLFATSALAATEVPLPPKRPTDLPTTTASVKPPVGCVSGKEINDFLAAEKFYSLLRSTRVTQKVTVETWINPDGKVITVSYDTVPANTPVQKACVVDYSTEVGYNSDTIEILNRLLQKTAPKT